MNAPNSVDAVLPALNEIATRLQQMADTATPPPGLGAAQMLAPTPINSGAGIVSGPVGPSDVAAGVDFHSAVSRSGTSLEAAITGMAGSMDNVRGGLQKFVGTLHDIDQRYSQRMAAAHTPAQQQAAQAATLKEINDTLSSIPRSQRSLPGTP